MEALKSYEHWLKTDLLARSNGDFRIGAENYQKKLMYEEMVDIPLNRLLEIGYENLRANQQELVNVCRKIDATKTPQQIAEKLESDHPAPDQLLQSFRDTLGGLIDFINAHRIITIPSTVRPILEETPPFARALTTASMDTPGPYEKVATEAYFQCHAAGEKLVRKRDSGIHDGLQSRNHREHGDTRGVSRTLCPAFMVSKGAVKSPEAHWMRHEYRGVGALYRRDDAG
jgi:hypothetical protein